MNYKIKGKDRSGKSCNIMHVNWALSWSSALIVQMTLRDIYVKKKKKDLVERKVHLIILDKKHFAFW